MQHPNELPLNRRSQILRLFSMPSESEQGRGVVGRLRCAILFHES